MRRLAAVLLTAVVVVAGCATIIHGTTQDVGISSTPTGAVVAVDNKPLGNTPVIAHLSRKEHHIVTLKLDGYEPGEMTLTRSVSGWVWGNIVFGGLIGLAVDAISGGLYKLTPEQLAANLQKKPVSLQKVDGLVYVAVVMRPDPAWQKVGQLQRAR